jgi:hypothetical protein
LSDGGQNKLVLGASWATKSKPAELQDAFQVRKSHLNLLRSRRDCSKLSVPTNDRAMSRACSWISRGILRAGSFGHPFDRTMLVVGGSGSNGQAVELICAGFIGIS